MVIFWRSIFDTTICDDKPLKWVCRVVVRCVSLKAGVRKINLEVISIWKDI